MRAVKPLPLMLALLAALPSAQAQQVTLSGLAAGRALLSVDGDKPRFLAPGESHHGVKVIGTGPDHAVVEINGRQLTLRMGQAPLTAGNDAQTGRRIVLVADGGGHFVGMGKINGQTVTFLVDTGATTLVLSEKEAQRIGLRPEQGRPARVKTANGEIKGYGLMLNSVQLGAAVGHNVAAVVLPADMPYVLLGNSFLSRFNLQRENDRLILDQRY